MGSGNLDRLQRAIHAIEANAPRKQRIYVSKMKARFKKIENVIGPIFVVAAVAVLMSPTAVSRLSVLFFFCVLTVLLTFFITQSAVERLIEVDE
jgi:hypothetical protein